MLIKFITLIGFILLLLSCWESGKREPIKSNAQQRDTIYRSDPEGCKVVIQDTILNTSSILSLEIRKYCFENNGFEVAYESRDTVEMHFYPDFAVDVKLMQKEKVIYKEAFEKNDFASLIDDKDFLSHAYITLASLDSYNQQTKEVIIKLMIAQVESDYAYFFEIRIDANGNKEVKLVLVT